MRDFLQQYFWVASLPFVVWFAMDAERRAYGLAGAGLLSRGEASRVTRLTWFSTVAIILAILIPQLTATGKRGYCAWYADPLRPGALVGWALFAGVLLRLGSLVATSAGRTFLTRAWPAVMIKEPLSRVWRQRTVVRENLLGIGSLVLFLGALLYVAVTKPNSVAACFR